MQGRSSLPFLVVLVLSVTFAILAAGDSPRKRTPLDLPSGGIAPTDDEESAPELITFFGETVEGDGFFFCFNAYYSP